ncbi:MAG: hypothetical protein IE916_00580 [Epsilonproteobacteria bacterium]|nr:hypothetical protein [Campylobacterota bacterium]
MTTKKHLKPFSFTVGTMLQGYSNSSDTIHIANTSLSPDEVIRDFFLVGGKIKKDALDELNNLLGSNTFMEFTISKEYVVATPTNLKSVHDLFKNRFVALVKNEYENFKRDAVLKGAFSVEYIVEVLKAFEANSKLHKKFSFS